MSRKGNHVSDVLAEVFRRGGMKRAVKRAEAVLLWPQVVGPEVAKFTEAKVLRDGVLFVETSDSETSMHLMLQRQRFIDVYQGKFAVKELRDIQFRVGRPRRKDEPVRPTADPPQVDAAALSRLARNLGDLPETLVQPAIHAAKALLVAQQQKLAAGWLPCPICKTLTDTQALCITCQRYRAEPRVKRAAEELSTDPDRLTPLLSEDERLVAIHLAKDRLSTQIVELLPQVLANPGSKAVLESAALCYVALHHHKALAAVSDEDLLVLDSRVLRIMGRW